jgi:hypothetical protein
MKSKTIAFVITMAALGNVLSFIPIGLSRIGQVGFDLSHVTTFIVAFYGGPILGFITALVGGVTAGVQFGPLGWLSWLGLIGLPLGKSLTGVTSGVLVKALKIDQKSKPSLFMVPMVLLGYIPEFLFTVFFFLALVPYFLGWLDPLLLISIAIKAWMEMGLMSVLMGALVGNSGFSAYMSAFFNSHKPKIKS